MFDLSPTRNLLSFGLLAPVVIVVYGPSLHSLFPFGLCLLSKRVEGGGASDLPVGKEVNGRRLCGHVAEYACCALSWKQVV